MAGKQERLLSDEECGRLIELILGGFTHSGGGGARMHH